MLLFILSYEFPMFNKSVTPERIQLVRKMSSEGGGILDRIVRKPFLRRYLS